MRKIAFVALMSTAALSIVIACSSFEGAPTAEASDAEASVDQIAAETASDSAPPTESGCVDACLPTLVAKEMPDELAANIEGAAWTRGTSIYGTLPDGGVLQLHDHGGVGTLSSRLALSGKSIHFTDDKGIRTCVLGGPCGNAAVFTDVNALRQPGLITTNVDGVYTVERTDGGDDGGRVISCPKANCRSPNVPTTLGLVAENPRFIAVSQNSVLLGFNGVIRRYGGASGQLVASTTALGGLAADETFVFFTDKATGEVIRCNGAACGAKVNFAKLNAPSEVALFGGRVYTIEAGSKIVSCAVDPVGCADKKEHVTAGQIVHLAITTDRIYYASGETGSIYSVPR